MTDQPGAPTSDRGGRRSSFERFILNLVPWAVTAMVAAGFAFAYSQNSKTSGMQAELSSMRQILQDTVRIQNDQQKQMAELSSQISRVMGKLEARQGGGI